jgi:hypothetical protein
MKSYSSAFRQEDSVARIPVNGKKTLEVEISWL